MTGFYGHWSEWFFNYQYHCRPPSASWKPGPHDWSLFSQWCCCRIYILDDFPKLVDSNGCVEEPPLKKESKENESKWKSFWITNTKCSQIRRTPVFFIHKILPSFSNISRLRYTTLILRIIHINQSFFYKHSIYPLLLSLSLFNLSFTVVACLCHFRLHFITAVNTINHTAHDF